MENNIEESSFSQNNFEEKVMLTQSQVLRRFHTKLAHYMRDAEGIPPRCVGRRKTD